MEELTVCSNCDCEMEEGDEITTVDGHVCQDCLDDLYACCEDCGDYTLLDDYVSINGGNKIVCGDCGDHYYVCDECGERFSRRFSHYNTNLTICSYCADNYGICANCEDVFHNDNLYYHEQSDNHYCANCFEEQPTSVIKSYNYRPTAIFYGEGVNVTNFPYGLEVEVDGGRDADATAASVQDITDALYIKHDGSLDDGFEIVTHPCTLDYHMNHFPWEDVTRAARRGGFKSHDTTTCGLHIHASKLHFGNMSHERELNIAKCIILFSRFWESHIVPFSRRDYRGLDWAKKPDYRLDSNETEESAIYKAGRIADGDRYQAINLQPRHTVEFRIFRGTLKRDTIIASIQFVDTVIKYARATPLKDIISCAWTDIFPAIEYKELREYMISKKLLCDEGRN